jgi:hypothetical protein
MTGEAWRPIETAPNDGTQFLAWDESYGDEVYVTGWSTVWAGWFSDQYEDRWQDRPIIERPTHWMPLPAPPEKQGGGQ